MSVPLDQWDQFGGNPAGSGFRAVNSIAPVDPPTWTVSIPSDIGAGSPVVGVDGTVFVGSNAGSLFACGPVAGQPRRRWERVTTVAAYTFAVHTPAIATDGTAYCLCTSEPYSRDHRDPPPPGNILVAVNANGSVRWTVGIPPQQGDFGWSTGFVRGAPRVLSRGSEARVFFVVDYQLKVDYGAGGAGPMYARHLAIVDDLGAYRLFHRYEEERLFVDAGGGGGIPWPGSAHLEGDPPEPPPGPRLPSDAHAYTDTPVVFGSMSAHEPWTIVAVGRSGLYALRWNDVDGEFAEPLTRFSPTSAMPSPCAFQSGLLASVHKGWAVAFDVATLTPWWRYWPYVGVDATVAGGLRHMYFLARGGTLRMVDANGRIVQERELAADTVSSPVVSGNYVYAATMAELRTLTLDLQDVASVIVGNRGWGRSSPAIGPDGSVYFAIGQYLHGYVPKKRTLVPL
jgi:putative pyrroloquinoline-quinone-binding quinoprotein